MEKTLAIFIRKTTLFLSFCLGIHYITLGQFNPAEIDNSFNIGSGIYGTPFGIVETIAQQPDGKILIGGNFTSYNGTGVNHIARLNTDGSIDNSFMIGSGFDSYVYSIAIQPDGKILVAGGFSAYNGVTKRGVVRLNSNGSLDAGFLGVPNGTVNSVVLQSDGKILIGGFFSRVNTILMGDIARLNSNGSLDVTFNVGSGINDGAMVNIIVLQSDGKILIGGDFTSYNGTSTNRIARLNANGSIDNSFITGDGFDHTVYSIANQSDNKILVGGAYITSYNSISTNRIARLNVNGSIDNSFIIGNGFDHYINAIVVQSDDRILVGGDFTSYNSTTMNDIGLLNPNGSIDNGFTLGSGTNGAIKSIVVQSNGKILVGGSFNTYNGTGKSGIVRLWGNTTTEVINHNTNLTIYTYPNPASDYVLFKTSNQDKHYKLVLTDFLGQEVGNYKINAEDFKLSLTNFSKGMYFYKITDDIGNIDSGKFIIE